MIYEFHCPNGHVTDVAFPMKMDVPRWLPCLTCLHGASRRFSANFMLITDRTVDKPENRIGGVGYGEKYRLEEIRREAALTEAASRKPEHEGTKGLDEIDTRSITESVLKEAALL